MAKRVRRKPLPHKKRGAKRIELNWKEFEKLCKIQTTLGELASYFDCSEDTIEARVKEKYGMNFSEVYKLKAGTGKVSLRRKQWQLALGGHAAMLIYLGKQHLDQSDKLEIAAGYDVGPYR